MDTNETQNPDPSDAVTHRRGRARQVIIRVTVAVLTLSAIPYLANASDGGVLLFIPPVISCCLIVFALFKVRQGFYLEDNLEFNRPDTKEGGFISAIGAITYIVLLGVLAFLHFLLLSARQFGYV